MREEKMKVAGGVLLILLGGALVLYCGMSTLSFYGSNEENTWWKVAGAVGALQGLSAVAVGLWLLMRGIAGQHTPRTLDWNRSPAK
jgi:hypothetical protein